MTSFTDEDVEKAAMAAWEAYAAQSLMVEGHKEPWDYRAWKDLSDEQREGVRKFARAALSSLDLKGVRNEALEETARAAETFGSRPLGKPTIRELEAILDDKTEHKVSISETGEINIVGNFLGDKIATDIRALKSAGEA